MPTTVAALRNYRENTAALEQLFTLVEEDQDCSNVLRHFKAGRGELNHLYARMKKIGLGQYAGSKYIPCYALANPSALYYLLHHFKLGSLDEAAAFRLLEYYQDGVSVQQLFQNIPHGSSS